MVVDEAEVAATIIAFQRPLEADMASAIDGVWRADMTGRPVPGDPPDVVPIPDHCRAFISRFQRIYGTKFGTQLKRIWRDQW